jgi:hypothetical protein
MAKSALEQVRELEEQKQALIGKAKEEAIAKASEAIEELKALGFNYRLWKGKEAKDGKGSIKDIPCKICGFKTSPPHDRRAHRSQKRKRTFTAAELQELAYTRV